PTLSAFTTPASKAYGDAPFALTIPTSNSTGAFSFSSGTPSVATISANLTVNALNFDGTNDFVDLVSNITEMGKASFTIECWIKTTATGVSLVNCQNGNTTWELGEKSFYIDSAGILAFVGFGNSWIYSTQAVNDGLWHHVAVVWAYSGSGTSGTGYTYVDGQDKTNAVSKLTFNGALESTVRIASGISIGSNDFTIEWYQYQTDGNVYPRPFEFNYRNPAVSFEGGNFYYWTNSGNSNVYADLGTYKNTWVHFAIVRISGIVTVYKNGTAIISNFADTTNFTSNSALTIGNQESNPVFDSSFGGSIQYFHLINGVGKYTGAFTPSTASAQVVTANSLLLIDSYSYQGTLSGSVVASNVVFEAYDSAKARYTANNNNSGTFVVGKPNNSETTSYFNGSMAELRIWNTARSGSQIYQNFRRILNGNESGLVAYLRLNQGAASGANTGVTTAANNMLTGGYAGTLTNFALTTGATSNWVSGI
ncbi:MAG: hypothetical protein EBQ97_05515, partial [Bacteroidetes bacterium]|nr:hypothetical protein [Bacteroidota bacterium]